MSAINANTPILCMRDSYQKGGGGGSKTWVTGQQVEQAPPMFVQMIGCSPARVKRLLLLRIRRRTLRTTACRVHGLGLLAHARCGLEQRVLVEHAVEAR